MWLVLFYRVQFRKKKIFQKEVNKLLYLMLFYFRKYIFNLKILINKEMKIYIQLPRYAEKIKIQFMHDY